MGKKTLAAIAAIMILAFVYGIYFFYFNINGKQAPKAVDGYQNLEHWSFTDSGVVPLNGDWEFYPHKLLFHEDLSTGADHSDEGPPGLIEVPDSWSEKMDTLGIATYRLMVKVDNDSPIYGLKTSSIQISNRIIVNGRVVGESGNPAEQPVYKARNKPYVAYFSLQNGWNEMIVQAANYELPASGGINEAIYFGYASQISALRDKAIAHDWITFTSFLIMGLYFIGLYSQRRKDYSLIAFGMICLCLACYTASSGERILLDLFPSISFWLYLRIQIFSALGANIWLLLYLYIAFRDFVSKQVIQTGVAIGIILAAITLINPLYTKVFQMTAMVYNILPLFYVVYVFLWAAFRKVEGSWFLVIAALALQTYATLQLLNINFIIEIYWVMPFEPFLFLLMLALLMSLRFSNAFRKIEELSVQLIHVDKLKDEFLARTSHEFKSPLHGVLNISKSLLEDQLHPLAAEQRERVQLINSITGRLSQLVYDILDLSKLKQGELTLYPASVDVHTSVEIQLEIYTYLSAGRNIQLENRVSEQVPHVWADESRFSQIVSNLLDNAVKHTENGSIVVSAKVNHDKVEISVQDTGEGIDEQDIPLIFEPFKSLDTTMEHKGFGLGLSIVKQLVELQQGEISVVSAKGVGTTFTFTLPIDRHGSKREADTRSSRSFFHAPEYSFPTPYYLEQEGKHTVLIVDDSFSNLKVLIDALLPLGYNVIAVRNGYEVMDQIGKPHAVNLVILDLMMPGLSGYEVCREIRKKYTMLELPVLMVTAAIQPQNKAAAFEAGANDFLPKPFDATELKARIGSLLAMKDSFNKTVGLEMAFLQSQIKPHFLYNVLNSIVASSYTDVERSRKLTTVLADYLRGSFQFSNVQKRSSFKQELGLIRSYVELERARFKERIKIEYDIAEEMHEIRIPPLLIQPLVENAIRHGIGSRLEGGTVRIKAHKAEREYLFVVEDDGLGIESGKLARLFSFELDERQGVGLLNINKRLKYEYGTELQVESEAGKGTTVTVRIPAEWA